MICQLCHKSENTRKYSDTNGEIVNYMIICDRCISILEDDDILTVDINLEGDREYDESYIKVSGKNIRHHDIFNIYSSVDVIIFKNGVRQIGFEIELLKLKTIMEIFGGWKCQ